MRTLEVNKSKLWLVNSTGSATLLDSDGFDTGEKTMTYSTPVIIYLNIYPSGGTVSEQIFGKDASLDMIAVSNDVILTKDSLLYLTLPTTKFGTTYDYQVSNIKKSINTYNYGLRNRT